MANNLTLFCHYKEQGFSTVEVYDSEASVLNTDVMLSMMMMMTVEVLVVQHVWWIKAQKPVHPQLVTAQWCSDVYTLTPSLSSNTMAMVAAR
ncbi:hypothetical protein CRM22_004211 [Opisthorchis felineus]|uniref:Uncharacterized protein n=1 Tax=Opisthorchis felineus TaxID=147828 RepID=A0A4V6RH24_OPIFE|nr:hypothetical protein CRM22_004211 [Opisthorchis felineus]